MSTLCIPSSQRSKLGYRDIKSMGSPRSHSTKLKCLYSKPRSLTAGPKANSMLQQPLYMYTSSVAVVNDGAEGINLHVFFSYLLFL